MRHYLQNTWQLIVIVALLIYIISNPPVVVAEIVHAAPAHAAPTLAAGCDYLATVDTVKIYQCVDFDGDKFLASTGAFLEYQKAGGE